jgi:hypothetical protein
MNACTVHRFLVTAIVAVTAANLSGCASLTPGAAPTAQADDAKIAAKVRDRLISGGTVGDNIIAIQSRNGEVTLSGFAHTPFERAEALEIARKVPGVRRVKNQVVVRG